MKAEKVRISEKTKRIIKTKTVSKPRYYKDSDYAEGGRVFVGVGPVLRKKLDLLAEQTGQTYSYIMRLALDGLIQYVLLSGSLPEFKDKSLMHMRGAKRGQNNRKGYHARKEE